jgi:hypothetical protein
MSMLRWIADELIGLFVDDGSLVVLGHVDEFD